MTYFIYEKISPEMDDMIHPCEKSPWKVGGSRTFNGYQPPAMRVHIPRTPSPTGPTSTTTSSLLVS